MSIGANWAEIWGPVWGTVWSQSPAPPPPSGGDSLQADLQEHCRFLAGTSGSFNEDLYSALCLKLGIAITAGYSLSGLLTLIPGGLDALVEDPTLLDP